MVGDPVGVMLHQLVGLAADLLKDHSKGKL
jgi:hypothetical protein